MTYEEGKALTARHEYRLAGGLTVALVVLIFAVMGLGAASKPTGTPTGAPGQAIARSTFTGCIYPIGSELEAQSNIANGCAPEPPAVDACNTQFCAGSAKPPCFGWGCANSDDN